MITGNRNAAGPESLEMTIRQRHTPNCLPVLTLADPDRIQRDRLYAEAVVERLFGFPFPNHVSKAACRERIVYRMMAHKRILDEVSQGGKRIRSQELKLLPDSIAIASPHILLQGKSL
jgi:hypothetical protein